MSKKTKNLILIGSFAVFFLVSFLTTLYAFGYWFDFENFKWLKTGGVFIKANSNDISVFISDELQGKTSFLTASFIEKNMLPGSYQVRFEKDGLIPVTKEIEVKSGEAAQLIHIYLTNARETQNFIAGLKNEIQESPFFINKSNGLLYKKTDKGAEKISSEPVYIKKFSLKIFENDVYLVSQDSRAPGVFLLDSDGNWDLVNSRSASDLALSPDRKKLAIISPQEVNILWLKDENEFPYFRKNHLKPILKVSSKIKEVFWFKTSWHLIYLTDSGEIYFVEVDGTGGQNEVKI